VATVESDRQLLRADLAAELGFHPASLTPDEVERHRRLNAAARSDSPVVAEEAGRIAVGGNGFAEALLDIANFEHQ
jgi:hypothetical protein